MVDGQATALRIHTETLGFVKRLDIPMGEFRCITVASPEGTPDVQPEHARLCARGVVFRKPPTVMGPVTIPVFDDTCGNLIQLHQA